MRERLALINLNQYFEKCAKYSTSTGYHRGSLNGFGPLRSPADNKVSHKLFCMVLVANLAYMREQGRTRPILLQRICMPPRAACAVGSRLTDAYFFDALIGGDWLVRLRLPM